MVSFDAQRLAKRQPKRSVGCPAEAAPFAAGVNLSNLLCIFSNKIGFTHFANPLLTGKIVIEWLQTN